MLRKKSIFILSTAIVLGGFLALNELEPSITGAAIPIDGGWTAQ